MSYRKTVSLALVGLVAVLAAYTACAAVAPKVLHEKTSAYNRIVVTEDDDGLRTLSFGNGVRQSVVKPGDPDHLELRYAPAMLASLTLVEEPKRVLIVGLGGGTIPGFVRKHYPRTTIDVVDIDPDVVDAAKRFFGFREDTLMHAHVRDGRKFIEECRDPYDVIFLDAFGPDSIPYHLATREFLQAVRRALAPKGIVASNVWSDAANPLYNSMVRTYQDVFREVYILDAPGVSNKIVIGLAWEGRLRPEDVAPRARRIAKEKQFRFDMGELITSGFQRAAGSSPDGRVLLDKDKQ
jgi:spermidine synthase